MKRVSIGVAAAAIALLAFAPNAMAAGDAAKGKQDFAVCSACHTVEKGAGNSIGPNLFGVGGRKAASLPSYSYSAALRNAKITWTNDKLKQWVMGPAKMVPGTKMTFAGFPSAAKADDVVAYLDTLK